jgi:hypothetical protein
MKITAMIILGCAALFISGCASSHTQAADSRPAVASSSVYDPASDTTTVSNGGFTWRLKGNYTNATVEARP